MFIDIRLYAFKTECYNVVMDDDIQQKKLISEAKRAHLSRIGRIGGLRKRGTTARSVVERNQLLEIAKDIVAGRTRKLIDAQTMMAMGCIKVFVVRTFIDEKGNKVKGKPVIVSDEDEIANALDHEFAEGDTPNNEMNYYFVMTDRPDNQAINSLLDRTFGKPIENKNIVLQKGMGELLDELSSEE